MLERLESGGTGGAGRGGDVAARCHTGCFIAGSGRRAYINLSHVMYDMGWKLAGILGHVHDIVALASATTCMFDHVVVLRQERTALRVTIAEVHAGFKTAAFLRVRPGGGLRDEVFIVFAIFICSEVLRHPSR